MKKCTMFLSLAVLAMAMACNPPLDDMSAAGDVNVNVIVNNFPDGDGDGNRSPVQYEQADEQGYGTVVSALSFTDCDDNDADIFGAYVDPVTGDDMPAHIEICDGKDNDCNGIVDDGVVCECWTHAMCDDSNVCNGVETCVAGICAGGDDLVCDDGIFCNGLESCDETDGCQSGADPCPTNMCDEDGDVCANCLSHVDCDDNNVCNGVETCLAGICADDDDLVCDDSDICNGIESCDATLGCQVGTALTCDDDLFCNGLETCDATLGCKPGVAPVIDDGVVCTIDVCDEDLDLVVNTANDLLCNDDNVCNGIETCDTTLGCKAGTALVCDDNNVCNGTETCDAILGCEAGITLVCDDAEACTIDTCDATLGCQQEEIVECCNFDQGWSSDQHCQQWLPQDLGDDYLWGCFPPMSDDQEPGFCSACEDIDGDGNCATNEEVCYDGYDGDGDGDIDCGDTDCDNLICSDTAGTCVDSTCVEPTPDCALDIDCDDGNECTDDTCVAGICLYGNNNDPCDDGDPCTLDDECKDGGICFPGPALECEDGFSCVDGTCVEDECVEDVDCDDGDACTIDSCDATLGCVNVSIECVDGVCNPDDGICVECLVDADCIVGFVCSDANECIEGVSPQCTTNADCPNGQFCGGGYCYVVTDHKGRTGLGQSGADGGLWPDGSPDSWDNDGDCYCETLPCHGSVNVGCTDFFGGDCDDTATGMYNNPGVPEWTGDNFDNNCDGTVL